MSNAEYFNKMADSIDAADSCAELQAIAADAGAAIAAQQAAIAAEVAKLAPILALATAPNNLATCITWITNFISGYLQPLIAPQLVYAAQLAELTAAIANLQSAIDAASDRFTDCTVTFP